MTIDEDITKEQAMRRTTDSEAITAQELQIALNEMYPNATYGSVPVADQYDALASYRAIDYDALSEVPTAFAAFLAMQRNGIG